MLDDNISGGAGQSLKMTERCKPDYEEMILRLRERTIATGDFRNAALAYHKGKTARDKMAELIGELVTKHAQLALELESLINQQEEDTR